MQVMQIINHLPDKGNSFWQTTHYFSVYFSPYDRSGIHRNCYYYSDIVDLSVVIGVTGKVFYG